MGQKFQLILPNAISRISVREAAALTAFSIHSESNSVNSVLELVKKTGDAIIREQVLMALDDRVDDVIRDIPSFNTSLFRSGEVDEFYVSTFQDHLVYLRKLFRTGNIESREMVSNTPINQDATDRIIDSAVISLQDFKKFASQLDIVVSVEGEMKVVDSEVTDKPMVKRERDTLLTIIAGLCSELGYDYLKTAKTGELIEIATSKINARVGKTTVIEKLKDIPKALESRME